MTSYTSEVFVMTILQNGEFWEIQFINRIFMACGVLQKSVYIYYYLFAIILFRTRINVISQML